MSKKDFFYGFIGIIIGFVICYFYNKYNVNNVVDKYNDDDVEPFDLNSISTSLKLLGSDVNGNITMIPNVLNDLQIQINAQNSKLDEKVAQLNTQINNIINGTTNLQNLVVNGVLHINSADGYPIRINKTVNDKTALINYTINGNKYKHWGVDGNGNPWCGGGWNTC